MSRKVVVLFGNRAWRSYFLHHHHPVPYKEHHEFYWVSSPLPPPHVQGKISQRRAYFHFIGVQAYPYF